MSLFKKTIKHFIKLIKKARLKELVVLCIAVFLFLGGVGIIWFATFDIPDLSSFNQRIFGESTKIFDRTGKVLLYDMGQNIRRTVVPLEEVSPFVKQATIAIEDEDFYKHHGIKVSSLFRAVLVNIQDLGYSQGGSTITQQVVKNSLLTKEKTITRKVKEIFLAIRLEQKFTKDEILGLYLNDTPYGGTLYGIEEASLGYFGTSSKNLTLAQAAYLAALPQAPTYFSPYGRHREELENRKNLVLQRMKDNGYIDEEAFSKAKEEKVDFAENISGGIKAPHFVMYIREYLTEKYGERAVSEGGLKVITTLDYEMQTVSEEIIKKYALENAKLYNATNAGLTAIDPKTGQILVMVGSRDFFDEEIDGQYNIATAKRQPGSSFKPLVYLRAFEKGYTDETVLFDVKTQFSSSCPKDSTSDEAPCYSPGNYDGKFRGPMTLRNALAQSINIPAVKLLYLVGINDAINFAKSLGITTLTDPSRYGLSLVLGGGEVTLLDMTSAYSVFANQGTKNPATGILEVKDKSGNIIESFEDKSERVADKNATLILTDILKDDVARTPIFGARGSMFFSNREVAAKTGTTNNYRDTWVIGYTPNITVGAWAGNNDNSSIDRKVAGYIVAPMWHAVMVEILKKIPDEKFEKPVFPNKENLKPILRGVWQIPSSIKNEENKDVSIYEVHNILHWVDKENPNGETPKNPYIDPQYEAWEYAVSYWAESGNYSSPDLSSRKNGVNITVPKKGDNYKENDPVPVSITVSGNTEVNEALYFINGNYIGKSNPPFTFFFIPKQIGNLKGNTTLKVIVKDATGNESEDSVEIKID